jgi:4,5-dihydroxyphthalate decarboxylase
MADPKLRFRFHEPTIDLNRPISEGTVKVDGFTLELVDREGDADAWDHGFGALVRDKVNNAPYVCIPAFPNRKFRLSYIFVNGAAKIDCPRDLEDKRVGISSWGNTAGVWARGALQNFYGVDLTRIKWFAPRPDATPVAPGIRIERLPKGGSDALLLAGELDAVIEPNVLPSITKRDPRVRRLFRDYKREEQLYFQHTGIFPISHVVTLTQEFVNRHPGAPVALLKAFRRARDMAFDRLQGSDPDVLAISWASAAVDEQRALMGDSYWPYNVENNRRVLEAMTLFAFQQGLTPERIDYESLFAPEAAALVGA